MPVSENAHSIDTSPQGRALLRAALDQSIAEDLSPAIERCLASPDPMAGLASLIDAAIAHQAPGNVHPAGGPRIRCADRRPRPLYVALESLTTRAQRAGLLRP